MSPWTALREEARAYYSVSPPCASRLAFNIDVSLSLSLSRRRPCSYFCFPTGPP